MKDNDNKIAEAVLLAYKHVRNLPPSEKPDAFIEKVGEKLVENGISKENEFVHLKSEELHRTERGVLKIAFEHLEAAERSHDKLPLLNKFIDSVREILGLSNSIMRDAAKDESLVVKNLKNQLSEPSGINKTR